MVGSGAVFILTFYLVGYFLAIIMGYTLMLLSFGVKNKSKIFFIFFDGVLFSNGFSWG